MPILAIPTTKQPKTKQTKGSRSEQYASRLEHLYSSIGGSVPPPKEYIETAIINVEHTEDQGPGKGEVVNG